MERGEIIGRFGESGGNVPVGFGGSDKMPVVAARLEALFYNFWWSKKVLRPTCPMSGDMPGGMIAERRLGRQKWGGLRWLGDVAGSIISTRLHKLFLCCELMQLSLLQCLGWCLDLTPPEWVEAVGSRVELRMCRAESWGWPAEGW
jgi:hypothetical protein